MIGHELDQCTVSAEAEKLASIAQVYLLGYVAEPMTRAMFDEQLEIEDIELLVDAGVLQRLSKDRRDWLGLVE